MTRIAGFIAEPNRVLPDELTKRMAAALAIEPTYQVSTYEGTHAGLVCVDHGIVPNHPARVVWNEEQTICVALAGELFGYCELRKQLMEQGHRFVHEHGFCAHAEFLLHLYEQMGDDFAIHLNGAFAAAILDVRKHELRLVNGRLGVRPLYYAHHAGRLLFGSGVSALLADRTLPRRINQVAIAEQLTYEYALNDQTLLLDAHVLPPATLLTVRNGLVTLRPYWQLRFAESTVIKESHEYKRQLMFYLRQAMQRQLPGELKGGINLSGGIDSRVAMGLLMQHQHRHPLRAYTFGIPGAVDVRYAREVAFSAGVSHTIYELQPEYLIENIEKGIHLTDGMESCVHMHALANVKRQSSEVQILYTGYLLDSIISPDANESWLARYSDQDAENVLRNDIHAVFKNIAYPDLFTDSFVKQIEDGYQASFRQASEGARHFLLSDWQNRLELLQRQRRLTQFGNELLHSHVLCRTPFLDNDLVDFCLTIPPGHRLKRAILKDVIALHFHSLAKVPLDTTGYPMVPCIRDVYLRGTHHAKWFLINSGLLKKKEQPPRPYANYNLWMRNELRPWVEQILLDKRTLDRGYLRPELIRDTVANHMNGASNAKELGMMLSIELWHRLYID